MQPRLRLRQRDRMLDLELGPGYRWFLGGAGVAFLAATALTTPGDIAVISARNAVPLGLAAVMLLGALYHERWRWNLAHRQVEHRVGVGPLAYSQHWPLAGVRSLRLGGVLIALPPEEGQGRLPMGRVRLDLRRSAVHLSLVDEQARVRRIELVKGPNGHQLVEMARAIASACGLPLRDEVRRQER